MNWSKTRISIRICDDILSEMLDWYHIESDVIFCAINMCDEHLHSQDTAYKHNKEHVLKHFSITWQQKRPDRRIGD